MVDAPGEVAYLPVEPEGHDVIVIGGSAGSFEVLRSLLKELPADFPAAVLIAVHIAPGVSLTRILGRNGSLPIGAAVSGEWLQRSRVYLAVADAHLLIHDRHLLVRRGPRENFSRPAIDPLFRSAACACGPRVIGVILSGGLNDGAAGLAAVKRCGGVTVVQDPGDAEAASMPQSALRTTQIDYCVAGDALAELLRKLVIEPPGPRLEIPVELKIETAIAAQEATGIRLADELGTQSELTCPECNGALWEMHDKPPLRYRCHTGHVFTAETMSSAQDGAADKLLWALLRAHEERAALTRKMALHERAAARIGLAEVLEGRAAVCEEDATIIRNLLDRSSAERADGP